MSAAPAPERAPDEKPRRLSLSQIVELLLTRSAGERSTVSLSRNARGETQIEVTVRTGDDSDVVTVEDAERRAREVYDRLADVYPVHAAHEVGAVNVTRNAKGETQIDVDLKTDDRNVATLELAAERVADIYGRLRVQFPMSHGAVTGSPPKP